MGWGYSQDSAGQFCFSWGWLWSLSVPQLTKRLLWRVPDVFFTCLVPSRAWLGSWAHLSMAQKLSTRAPTHGLFSRVASEWSAFLHGSWPSPEQVPQENKVKAVWPYLTPLQKTPSLTPPHSVSYRARGISSFSQWGISKVILQKNMWAGCVIAAIFYKYNCHIHHSQLAWYSNAELHRGR